MHKKGGNRSFGNCEYTKKSKNKQIFIDQVRNDRVRNDQVRYDRVRIYRFKSDRVRNDCGLEMIGSNFVKLKITIIYTKICISKLNSKQTFTICKI